MAWFASRRPPGRLFLTRADGRSLRRELPPECLERFAAQVLAEAADEVRSTWQRAGQSGTEAVCACWPESVPLPERALLGAGGRKQGPWLEAGYPKGAALEEIAEDLVRSLTGASVPERVVSEAVDAPPPPPARPRSQPVLRATEVRPPHPPAAQAAPQERPAPAEVLPPPEAPAVAAPAPAPILPEVLAPGARIAPARARTLRPRVDDVFGLWGQPHAADVEGDSPELRGEDLPWLCPGDRLYSPRRGLCRLLTVEDPLGRWQLRDERGREIEVSSSELTAEFSFDEEPHGA